MVGCGWSTVRDHAIDGLTWALIPRSDQPLYQPPVSCTWGQIRPFPGALSGLSPTRHRPERPALGDGREIGREARGQTRTGPSPIATRPFAPALITLHRRLMSNS